MGWGDEILAAGQAQRLYEADPSRRVAICGGDGRPRWHDIWEGNPILARPSEVAAGERVHTVINGPGCRPYIVYPFSKQSGWTFNTAFRCRDHVAKLYLRPEEWQRGIDARARYGSYVLIEPYTKHDNFRWPLDRWFALVKACPDLTFVEHMHADNFQFGIGGAHYEMASFREACGLIAAADIYVRSESGLCHAAAALGTRQVTLFGGCMDPDVMAGYPRQRVIADDGPRSPCGSWMPCQHCCCAMQRITVDQVVQALRQQLRWRRAA